MTLKQKIGHLLILSPFIVLFLYSASLIGLIPTTLIFLAALAIVAVVFLGAYLIHE